VSQESVELVREAFAVQEPRDASRFWSPEIEWVVAREHPEARTVRGSDAVLRYAQTWEETLTDLRIEIERLLDAGDTVVAVGVVRGTGTESSADVQVPIAFLVALEGGMITRVEEYLNPAEALEAVGLEE
jgi:ketosteroid isomerase-like protein